MINALARMIDGPAVTILGWTPSAEQSAAALAVAAGAIGALILMLVWRKARRTVLLGVVAIALLIVWIRIAR